MERYKNRFINLLIDKFINYRMCETYKKVSRVKMNIGDVVALSYVPRELPKPHQIFSKKFEKECCENDKEISGMRKNKCDDKRDDKRDDGDDICCEFPYVT